MGTYPSFAFTPSDDAVIIWAAGQIYSVPLTVNQLGEKLGSSTLSPSPIRFVAHIEKRLAETLRGGIDLVGMETKDTQRVRAFKELRVDDQGRNIVFQAAGVTYVQKVGAGHPKKVPVLHRRNVPYYSPSFVHGEEDLVLHARWSDANFTSFELANTKSGIAHEIDGLPLGRYFSPVLCECDGPRRQIAFVKSGGDTLTGDVVATAGAGLYIGDIILPFKYSRRPARLLVRNIRYVPSEIDPDDRVNMRFLEANKKLLVQQSSRSFVIDLGAGPNELGKYPHETLATGKMSTEIAVSPRAGGKGNYRADAVAFVDFFHVYFAPGDAIRDEEEVWSKPLNATKGLVRLSLDGGHDVSWSADGKKVFWFLGANLSHGTRFRALLMSSTRRTLPPFLGSLKAGEMHL